MVITYIAIYKKRILMNINNKSFIKNIQPTTYNLFVKSQYPIIKLSKSYTL